jgi:hypothetical protein
MLHPVDVKNQKLSLLYHTLFLQDIVHTMFQSHDHHQIGKDVEGNLRCCSQHLPRGDEQSIMF